MARLTAAKPHGLDPVRRLTSRFSRRIYGAELEPTRIIGHHKRLLAGYGALGLAFNGCDAVPQRYKSLGMLRTAQLIGCEWCLDFGSKLALDSGVPEEDLRELSLWRDSGRFDELDRLVLEFAEAATRTPVAVSDELFARLREQFDERQLVELSMAIALENLFSRVNWSFGIEGQGFSEGTFCVRPDAHAVL